MKNIKIWAVCMSLLALPIASQAEELVMVEISKGTVIKLSAPASSVVVADPEMADVQVISPSLLFVHGKKVGETSLFAVDNEDNTIYNATISVTHNISKLQSAIKSAVPNSDIRVRSIDGGITIDGNTDSIEESERIRNIASAFVGEKEKMVNMIQAAGSDQVALKVKIVEMSRNDMKTLGVNLQNLTSNGLFGLQLLQGDDILFHTTEADEFVFRTPGNTLMRPGTNSNLMLRYKDVTGVLDALETQGLLTTLAEPTLTTTSGKPASFLAGGEFPIPVKGSDGAISIEFKPFGVSLAFTPTVMSRDRISLDVAPEVSSISFDNPIEVDGITNPIILTRKAQSTIELGSGDTFMLAGLLKSDGSNSVSKFPGLGDLPVLGALFRSNNFQNNQTELVILVTPYLVKPISDPKKVQTPMDGYRPPSDLERLLLGSLYQQQDMPDKVEKDMPKLHGEGGFIYE